MYFNQNFTDVCSLGFSWQWRSSGSSLAWCRQCWSRSMMPYGVTGPRSYDIQLHLGRTVNSRLDLKLLRVLLVETHEFSVPWTYHGIRMFCSSGFKTKRFSCLHVIQRKSFFSTVFDFGKLWTDLPWIRIEITLTAMDDFIWKNGNVIRIY